MTTLPPEPDRRWVPAWSQLFSRRLLFIICFGGVIGTLIAFGLYVAKPAYVILLPAGLVLLLSTAFFKNYRLYWFGIFLFSMQFDITKNLNDGLAVISDLKIDYTIQHFTFEISATDLALLVLLAFWANDCLFHGLKVRFPPVSWLAVGYLLVSLASTIGAESRYLGFVEMSRQIKFFVVYLYAVNCLESKAAIRLLVGIGVITLVTQGAMTVTRFETGYMTAITLGETYQDESQIEQYLAVDRSDEGSWVRAFGTLGSPGSTVRLCMMVIPFALFLCVPNAMFKMRLVFLALTSFGILSLVLTFTRVYYITTGFQVVLSFWFMVRDRMLKRGEVITILLLALVGLAAASPKIYEQFTMREDSVSVRFLQYEAAGQMILDHPFLGVGLNNGTGEKQKYVNVTYNQFDPDTQFYLEPTHNMYLSLASEIGVFGAALFLAFFVKVTVTAWRQSRQSDDAEVRMTANALVVVFCSVAVNGFMDPLQEYPVLALLWLYAGISLNLSRIAQNSKIESVPQTFEQGRP